MFILSFFWKDRSGRNTELVFGGQIISNVVNALASKYLIEIDLLDLVVNVIFVVTCEISI